MKKWREFLSQSCRLVNGNQLLLDTQVDSSSTIVSYDFSSYFSFTFVSFPVDY